MGEELKFKKILVTGACGQLGLALTNYLQRYSSKIVALDIEPVKDPWDNDGHNKDELENLQFVLADLTREVDLVACKIDLEDVDYLVHLASIIEDSKDIKVHAQSVIDRDISGTVDLLKHLPALKGICFSSSYMIYGPTIYSPIDEHHPTDPINIYGVCKLAAEKFLTLYGQQKNISVTVLRYAGIYGPGTPADSTRLIPSVIRTVAQNKPPVIFGEGTELRETVYIDDAVSAIVSAIKQAQSDVKGTFNISSGKPYTAKELAELVIELSTEISGTGKLQPEYRVAPAKDVGGDGGGAALTGVELAITSAKDKLGYNPKITLREGLAEHIKWYSTVQNNKKSN
ncbi:MAG: NAD-dependent epimerase/dehydratase family protein [Thermoplasmata archaeon]|nr:MAG: NAD-dependent epimerase/dehydratase family protein [Thermoplasmata archaeon]